MGISKLFVLTATPNTRALYVFTPDQFPPTSVECWGLSALVKDQGDPNKILDQHVGRFERATLSTATKHYVIGDVAVYYLHHRVSLGACLCFALTPQGDHN
jgi:hypothetical protein